MQPHLSLALIFFFLLLHSEQALEHSMVERRRRQAAHQRGARMTTLPVCMPGLFLMITGTQIQIIMELQSE